MTISLLPLPVEPAVSIRATAGSAVFSVNPDRLQLIGAQPCAVRGGDERVKANEILAGLRICDNQIRIDGMVGEHHLLRNTICLGDGARGMLLCFVLCERIVVPGQCMNEHGGSWLVEQLKEVVVLNRPQHLCPLSASQMRLISAGRPMWPLPPHRRVRAP